MFHPSILVLVTAALVPQTAPPPAQPPAPPAGTAPAPETAPSRSIIPPEDEVASVNAPPPLEAEPRVLDFGFVPPRQNSSGSFKLWNRGRNPVRIVRVEPDCKCTTLEDVTGAVIAPGEFLELNARLEGAASPQQRHSTIKIVAEGYQQLLILELRATVANHVRALPPYLNVVSGKEKQGRIFIESIDKKPFRICTVQGEAPDYYLPFDPDKDEPRPSYMLRWDVTKFGDKLPTHWIIETDHPECPVLPVWIRHESTIPKPGFRLKEYSVNFGRVETNGAVEATIYMEDPGEPILTAAALSESATAELVGTQLVDEVLEVKVRVTPSKEFEGLLTFPLVIYSPTREMEIPAFGVVRPAGHACGGAG